jgi:hypothetical protein
LSQLLLRWNGYVCAGGGATAAIEDPAARLAKALIVDRPTAMAMRLTNSAPSDAQVGAGVPS